MTARGVAQMIGCRSSSLGNTYAFARQMSKRSSTGSGADQRSYRLLSRMAPLELTHGEPTGGKDSRMARRPKRQYGTGCVLETEGGLAIRWREWEITPDGTKRRVQRY